MSTGSSASFEEKCDTLQRRMHAQRLLIDKQLTSGSAASGGSAGGGTMQLLSEHPTLAAKLLTAIAVIQLGARVVAAVSTAVALTGIVHTVVLALRRQGPAVDRNRRAHS